MKIKYLLFILLFPLVLLGANTNKFDNSWTTSSWRFSGGTPGVGKLLVSDALGFGTWTTVASGTGAAALTNANNLFLLSSTNTFFAPATFSNMTINGTILNGGNNRWDVPANIIYDSGWPIIDLPAQQWKLVGGSTAIQFANRRLIDSSGVQALDWEAHTTTAPWTNLSSLTVLGVFSAGSNVVLGAQSGNSITVNASTMAIPNGLNIGSGRIAAPTTGAGAGTNYIGFPFVVGAIGTGPRLLVTTNASGFIVMTNLNGTGSIVLQ